MAMVPHAFAGADRMTDADIAGIAREAADTVCNCYVKNAGWRSPGGPAGCCAAGMPQKE